MSETVVGGMSRSAAGVQDGEGDQATVRLQNRGAFFLTRMGATGRKTKPAADFLGVVRRAAQNVEDLIRNEA